MHFLKIMWPERWFVLSRLRLPAWSKVIPEFQILLLVAACCTILFYNFVESPWYMNLVIFWMSAVITFAAFLLYGIFQKKNPYA